MKKLMILMIVITFVTSACNTGNNDNEIKIDTSGFNRNIYTFSLQGDNKSLYSYFDDEETKIDVENYQNIAFANDKFLVLNEYPLRNGDLEEASEGDYVVLDLSNDFSQIDSGVGLRKYSLDSEAYIEYQEVFGAQDCQARHKIVSEMNNINFEFTTENCSAVYYDLFWVGDRLFVEYSNYENLDIDDKNGSVLKELPLNSQSEVERIISEMPSLERKRGSGFASLTSALQILNKKASKKYGELGISILTADTIANNKKMYILSSKLADDSDNDLPDENSCTYKIIEIPISGNLSKVQVQDVKGTYAATYRSDQEEDFWDCMARFGESPGELITPSAKNGEKWKIYSIDGKKIADLKYNFSYAG